MKSKQTQTMLESTQALTFLRKRQTVKNRKRKRYKMEYKFDIGGRVKVPSRLRKNILILCGERGEP